MNLIVELSALEKDGIVYTVDGRSVLLEKGGKSIRLVDLPVGFLYEICQTNRCINIVSSQALTKNYQKIFYRKISGTYASLFRGAIIGLTIGYKKTLNLIGSGYRSSFDANERILSVLAGYSHPLKFFIPKDVKIELESNGTVIGLSGHNKQEVTQTAGIIYNSKKRNVYKGTGIFDSDRPVRTKEIKKK